MSAARAVCILGCLATGVRTAGAAQFAGTLDVGAGSNRPDRSIPGAVASFAPAFQLAAGPLRLIGTGVYSDAAGGRWNFQGASSAVLRTPDAGPFHMELTGGADWTWHHRVPGAAALLGEARVYAAPSAGSLFWLGRGVGEGWSLGRRRPLDRTVMGASGAWGRVRLGLSIASTTFDPMPAGGRSNAPGDSTIVAVPEKAQQERRTAYTDATLAGEWSVAGLRLDLSIGRRFSRTIPEMMLWGVTATRSVLPGVALLASAGRAGSDPITALPGSRYLVLGLRLSATAGSPYAAVARTVAAPSSQFRIGPARLTGREILVRAPGARVVEIAGDFTDWRTVELDPEPAGEWRVVLPVSPGLHRLAVRLDGGPWQAPPGIRPTTSEFGGEVGEVLVE